MKQVQWWISKYPDGRQQSAVIPVLWLVQKQEGWVSEPAIRAVAELLKMATIRSKIELACLVDRGHRELPIQPDYCGLTRVTGPGEYLRVLLREEDGQDGLFLVKSKTDPITPH